MFVRLVSFDAALAAVDAPASGLLAGGFLALTEPHVRAIAVTSQYVVWLTADGKVLRASSH
jgi:hypothetical protein